MEINTLRVVRAYSSASCFSPIDNPLRFYKPVEKKERKRFISERAEHIVTNRNNPSSNLLVLYDMPVPPMPDQK